MALSSEINRVKFIAEDFQTYRDEADEFFRTHYPDVFNNLIATDLGNALMDQLAFAMQSLSFMVNRRASELFLSTARLNRSITKLARMLGYTIRPASPSVTDLTVSLGQTYTFGVPIPIGFRFQGPGDTVYEYKGAEPAIIPAGATSIAIQVKEGTSRSLTFVSDGTQNQEFQILGIAESQFIYGSDFSVTVDGQLWTRSDLIGYENLNTYEVLFTEEPPRLRFGDGIAGNIPSENSQIVVSFRYGKGASGAVGQNQIKSVVSPLVVAGQTIPLTLTNPVSVVGENPEDIRHVRAFASTFFRTQNAAVIKNDYDTIAQLQTGVALADAQIVRGVENNLVVQGAFSEIQAALDAQEAAIAALRVGGVSGIPGLSVAGVPQLSVSGIEDLAVAGQEDLEVIGASALTVQGTDLLTVEGRNLLTVENGSIVGLDLLTVGGTENLTVGGTSQLAVGGVDALTVTGTEGLAVAGTEGLSVSGASGLGWNGLTQQTTAIESKIAEVESTVSSLRSHLSDVLSDTGQANHVQVILLSLDANNRYIAPSTQVISDVKARLNALKDAVVTVDTVSGIGRVIDADVIVEIGISQGAIASNVEQRSLNALVLTSDPFGLLVRREAGKSLYKSDVVRAVIDGNQPGDVVFVNVRINHPLDRLDSDGNLVITKQEIIQNGIVSVRVVKRLLLNGDLVSV